MAPFRRGGALRQVAEGRGRLGGAGKEVGLLKAVKLGEM